MSPLPGVGVALTQALGLGLLHGITPDEHTWPITMSYALGGATGRQGLRAGAYFSAAFAVQRALASELAYFALAGFLTGGTANAAVYLGVGLLMALSGLLIHRTGHAAHLGGPLERRLTRWLSPGSLQGGTGVPVRMALVHGFVAGWGTGAFAVVLYTTLAPAMPSAETGFLPGLVFGLGTLLVQAAAGAAAGSWLRRRGLPADVLTAVARRTAAASLGFGGPLFAGYGLIGLVAPGLFARLDRGIATGVHVQNLDSLNGGLVLVLLSVFVITGTALTRALRLARTSVAG